MGSSFIISDLVRRTGRDGTDGRADRRTGGRTDGRSDTWAVRRVDGRSGERKADVLAHEEVNLVVAAPIVVVGNDEPLKLSR